MVDLQVNQKKAHQQNGTIFAANQSFHTLMVFTEDWVRRGGLGWDSLPGGQQRWLTAPAAHTLVAPEGSLTKAGEPGAVQSPGAVHSCRSLGNPPARNLGWGSPSLSETFSKSEGRLRLSYQILSPSAWPGFRPKGSPPCHLPAPFPLHGHPPPQIHLGVCVLLRHHVGRWSNTNTFAHCQGACKWALLRSFWTTDLGYSLIQETTVWSINVRFGESPDWENTYNLSLVDYWAAMLTAWYQCDISSPITDT